MDKKYKIEIPELEINMEQRVREIKALLKEDFEKGGKLVQCFIFTYNNEPVSTTELADHLSRYYHFEYDRSVVFRNIQRLVKLGLLYTTTSGDVLVKPSNELTNIEKLILTKFKRFLDSIPIPFKNRYSNVNYFWVSNGWGLEFVKWSCEILKFKCIEDDKNNRKNDIQPSRSMS